MKKQFHSFLIAVFFAVPLWGAETTVAKIPQISDPVIYTDADKPMDDRIDDLIRRMSLPEKVNQLVNGAPALPRLNIPAYDYWNEGLHGVARNGHATVFPQAIGMAATWDDGLLKQIGDVIATEGRAKYYDSIRTRKSGRYHGLNFWSPNINIFRDPRWGRGQETYGEDPYLTSRLGVGFITGVQGNDPHYLKAMACAKHFAIHSGPEEGRAGFNVNPDPRDLYETFLPQFQAAVEEAHVGSVMAAYNAIDNVPCACNSWLLTDLLRKTWGFQGQVVSDCGAVTNIAKNHHYVPSDVEASALALKAGLSLECGHSLKALTQSVAKGLITEKEIDAALHQDFAVRFLLGLFDPPERVPFSGIAMTEVESPSHLNLCLQTARESLVLLKNDHALPLDKTKLKRIAVIGSNADDSNMMSGNYHGDPSAPVDILKGIRNEVGAAARH